MKRKNQSWRWGTQWCNDKLYRFEPTSVLVMKLWPDMLAWRRTACTGWRMTRRHADRIICDPVFQPEYLEHCVQLVGATPVVSDTDDRWWERATQRDNEALTMAFSTFPSRERLLASRYLERRWHLLAMMARCPGASDLVESNPGLAFSLASNWVFHRPAVKQPLRAARSLIRKKQVEILSWLGFPANERVRRILAKTEPDALTLRRIMNFRWQLRAQGVSKVLVHLPTITSEILGLLCNGETCTRATPKLLHQLAETARGPVRPKSDLMHLWREGKNLSETLGLALPNRLTSVDMIHQWHDEVHEFSIRNQPQLVSKLVTPP